MSTGEKVNSAYLYVDVEKNNAKDRKLPIVPVPYNALNSSFIIMPFKS